MDYYMLACLSEVLCFVFETGKLSADVVTVAETDDHCSSIGTCWGVPQGYAASPENEFQLQYCYGGILAPSLKTDHSIAHLRKIVKFEMKDALGYQFLAMPVEGRVLVCSRRQFDLLFVPQYNRPMTRRTEFIPYRPRTILNKHKRPDHWFWTRYTAYPYKGCQHRCLFCYRPPYVQLCLHGTTDRRDVVIQHQRAIDNAKHHHRRQANW